MLRDGDFSYGGLLHHGTVTVDDLGINATVRVQIPDMNIDISKKISGVPTDYELEQVIWSILYEREDINKDYGFSYRDRIGE